MFNFRKFFSNFMNAPAKPKASSPPASAPAMRRPPTSGAATAVKKVTNTSGAASPAKKPTTPQAMVQSATNHAPLVKPNPKKLNKSLASAEIYSLAKGNPLAQDVLKALLHEGQPSHLSNRDYLKRFARNNWDEDETVQTYLLLDLYSTDDKPRFRTLRRGRKKGSLELQRQERTPEVTDESSPEPELPFNPPCSQDDYADISCIEDAWEKAAYIRQFILLDMERWQSGDYSLPWNYYLEKYFPEFDSFDPTGPSYDGLPYLSASNITLNNAGREALAEATWKIWDQLGLFQGAEGLEQLADWINQHEHSVLLGNPEAMEYLNEYIHYTYYVVAGGDRVKFLAAWSVALFEQRNPRNPNTGRRITVEGRTYEFLLNILTPPTLSVDDSLNWAHIGEATSDFIESQYSSELINDLGPDGRALKTFGSTELASDLARCYLREYSELYVRRFSSSVGDVYLMTPAQWTNARNLQVPEGYICGSM